MHEKYLVKFLGKRRGRVGNVSDTLLKSTGETQIKTQVRATGHIWSATKSLSER